MTQPTELPTLIKVAEFAQKAGLSRSQAYEVVRRMPEGVKVRLGGRVRLNLDRLCDWLSQGGNIAS